MEKPKPKTKTTKRRINQEFFNDFFFFKSLWFFLPKVEKRKTLIEIQPIQAFYGANMLAEMLSATDWRIGNNKNRDDTSSPTHHHGHLSFSLLSRPKKSLSLFYPVFFSWKKKMARGNESSESRRANILSIVRMPEDARWCRIRKGRREKKGDRPNKKKLRMNPDLFFFFFLSLSLSQ